MKWLILTFLFVTSAYTQAIVVPHTELKDYTLNGNGLKGLATPGLGAKQFEIWRTTWAVGACTPKHTHETEEIFILLKGRGKVVIDGQETFFEAPCTIIAPAHKEHQFFNTGTEPTDAIVVLGMGSEIINQDKQPMTLPWRK
jgi:mannose-6-phosphate isomerase-like protein (cupin superfamily)